MKTLHPYVVEEALGFNCVGFASPPALAERGPTVLTPKYTGERIAVVAVDALRCSTTILALLARGARGVMTFSKLEGAGASAAEAEQVASYLGAELALAGELHGQPLPGGIVGNSPVDASLAQVDNKLIRFSSTNFGQLVNSLLPLMQRFEDAGGEATVFVGSFQNAGAVASAIRKGSYSRVVLAAGGFYSVGTVEDQACCGSIIDALGIDMAGCDDEAVTMLAVSRLLRDEQERLTACARTLIGRSLVRFGRGVDIPAVVVGEGLEPATRLRMQGLVATVQRVAGVPVIMPARSDGPVCDYPFNPASGANYDYH